MRAKQSSITQDFERELKAAMRGAVGSLTRVHWVFEEGGQWQACTNGLFLQPGLFFRSVARWLECRAEPPGVRVSGEKARQIRYSSKQKKPKSYTQRAQYSQKLLI